MIFCCFFRFLDYLWNGIYIRSAMAFFPLSVERSGSVPASCMRIWLASGYAYVDA